MTELLKILGQITAALVILVPLLIWLIKRWIDSEFNKNLEDYKHEINKNFEDYRHRINSLFSRITKIHEKEFEVLPEAWHLLQVVRGLVGALTSPFQRYQDLYRMDEPRLKDFLDDMEPKLVPSDQDKLLGLIPEERNDYFKERIFWVKLNEANCAAIDYHNYILDNKIFLTKDLFEQFDKADTILNKSILSQEIDKQVEIAKQTKEFNFDRYQTANEELEKVCAEIERLVQARLHHEDAF